MIHRYMVTAFFIGATLGCAEQPTQEPQQESVPGTLSAQSTPQHPAAPVFPAAQQDPGPVRLVHHGVQLRDVFQFGAQVNAAGELILLEVMAPFGEVFVRNMTRGGEPLEILRQRGAGVAQPHFITLLPGLEHEITGMYRATQSFDDGSVRSYRAWFRVGERGGEHHELSEEPGEPWRNRFDDHAMMLDEHGELITLEHDAPHGVLRWQREGSAALLLPMPGAHLRALEMVSDGAHGAHIAYLDQDGAGAIIEHISARMQRQPGTLTTLAEEGAGFISMARAPSGRVRVFVGVDDDPAGKQVVGQPAGEEPAIRSWEAQEMGADVGRDIWAHDMIYEPAWGFVTCGRGRDGHLWCVQQEPGAREFEPLRVSTQPIAWGDEYGKRSIQVVGTPEAAHIFWMQGSPDQGHTVHYATLE